MYNTKNPKKDTWFNGSNPLIYTMDNRVSNNFSVLGLHVDGDTLFTFKVGQKCFVGKGQLTNSGKNLRYLTHVQTDNYVTNLMEANNMF
jgi:hypothetical protein